MHKYIDICTHLLPDSLNSADYDVYQKWICDYGTSGIKIAVASPLFDAEQQDDISSFLEKRDDMLKTIQSLNHNNDFPEFKKGAEVCLSESLFRFKNLSDFRIENTNYILVKLPFPLQENSIALLEKLQIASNSNLIITNTADFYEEEYFPMIMNLKTMNIMLMIETEKIIQHGSRKTSLYLLCNDYAQIIGSRLNSDGDCYSYQNAMRVMRDSIPLEKYRRIKNNCGLVLSNVSASEVLNK